jgi:hypothetical protein
VSKIDDDVDCWDLAVLEECSINDCQHGTSEEKILVAIKLKLADDELTVVFTIIENMTRLMNHVSFCSNSNNDMEWKEKDNHVDDNADIIKSKTTDFFKSYSVGFNDDVNHDENNINDEKDAKRQLQRMVSREGAKKRTK